MHQLDIILEKIDKIGLAVHSIDKNVALEIAERKHIEARLQQVEKTSNQYKADRYKVIGGSSVMASIIAWLSRYF